MKRRSRLERMEADQALLEKRCAEWNAKYPVGTAIEYHPVIGAPEFRLRKTRSPAQVLSGHSAVVWLEGESGCVSLEACHPTLATSVPCKLCGRSTFMTATQLCNACIRDDPALARKILASLEAS